MKKIIAITLVLISSMVMAFAQKDSVALIIGNSHYEDYFKKLSTPVNDAQAMNWVLKTLGFETIVATNARQDDMIRLLEDFAGKAKNAKVALFYYSGHGGYTAEQRYYLIPSGEYHGTTNIAVRCIDFDAVERALKNTKADLQIAFIDACRSSLEASKGGTQYDPYARKKNEDYQDKEYGFGRALYFGTAESTAAFTGNGKLSIFTQSLLNHITETDKFNAITWGKIQKEVLAFSKNQKPTNEISKSFKDFTLNPRNISVRNTVQKGYEDVTITAEPSSANISINGKDFGKHVYMQFKYDTQYNVKVSAEGYETFSQTIMLQPNPYNQTEYSFNLVKLDPAKLTLSSNVKRATITMDGKRSDYIFPCSFNTFAGMHEVRVQKDNYYTLSKTLNLKAGNNFEFISLRKEPPRFFDWDEEFKHSIYYHFSPKYQIGLSYLLTWYNHFVLGAYLASSTGYFKGISFSGKNELAASTTVSIPVTITYEDGTQVQCEQIQEYIDGRSQEYSEFIDPYKEATHYDSNFLYMLLLGYQPWNGISFTVGVGGASHRDIEYMPSYYNIQRVHIKNPASEEILADTGYVYERTGKEFNYVSDKTRSLAIRIGAMINIPFSRYSDWGITFGGGYTYLPMNHKFSSWDVSIGLTIPEY